MITKVQSKRYAPDAAFTQPQRLTTMEKGLIRWSMAERGDKVLDVQVGNGTMLEYLHRNMECEICGMSADMEQVRHSRSRLQSADIMYATRDDIPWKQNTFDCVFLKLISSPATEQAITEALRVLKPGGQLLMGLKTVPAPIRQLIGLGHSDVENDMMKPRIREKMMQLMDNLGCTQVTWESTDLFNGVCIGWKPLETFAESEAQ